MAPESARRVNHPAPFPIELPLRLIDLYTYKGDLVLDPFMGSGTTAVAAVRAGRHLRGLRPPTPTTCAMRSRASRRSASARRRHCGVTSRSCAAREAERGRHREHVLQTRSVREGKAAKEVAKHLLTECGFRDLEEDQKLPGGLELNFRAVDQHDGVWYFDVSGAFSSTRPGLKRTDTLWKALGKALVLSSVQPNVPLVLITTDLPARSSAGDAALQQVTGPGQAVAERRRDVGREGTGAPAAVRPRRSSRARGRCALTSFQAYGTQQGRQFAEQCDALLVSSASSSAAACRSSKSGSRSTGSRSHRRGQRCGSSTRAACRDRGPGSCAPTR